MNTRNLGKRLGILVPWLVLIITPIMLFNYLIKGQVKSEIISTGYKKVIVTGLDKAVATALEGVKGNYGIFIKNFKTGETFKQNEHMIFHAGSLYKIWIMAETYNQIKTGDLTEDEQLSRDIEYLNKKFQIAEENAELTEGAITLTVANALTQMITISHNYAAMLLTEKIKLSSVAKFLKDNSFIESKVGINGEDPTTTPADMEKFFEKLYKGEIIDQEYSNKMLELLKAQKLNNKLPKNLPTETIIAHKTGELGFYTHDGGIVYSPKGDYIIIVMSQSDSPPGAEERIVDISEAVYKYFSR
ncbi:hypothetical protein A3J13_00855 [Candidatus Daviesbacteria bacterium RIFCSPLOWO2_02_FULL_36_8]|uniref:Beta-lactamase class A catalytic domain-containing protein n=1 Tax=Candidatus Daviesbacteria bacterium RIFCSPLOWO2_02_FULL_36_8 TaxID=1797793 RepID=A0A1F5MGM7_9BACT|nr:MAG: hypothetical protein A3J13_00855 [Candidatus Daviesbacteria bacterium RIFCSPLOWO2_02_FULL_36_8]